MKRIIFIGIVLLFLIGCKEECSSCVVEKEWYAECDGNCSIQKPIDLDENWSIGNNSSLIIMKEYNGTLFYCFYSAYYGKEVCLPYTDDVRINVLEYDNITDYWVCDIKLNCFNETQKTNEKLIHANYSMQLYIPANYSQYQKNVTATKYDKYGEPFVMCNLDITECWINTFYYIDYIMTGVLVDNNTPEFNYLFEWCEVFPDSVTEDCNNYTGYDHLKINDTFTWKDYRLEDKG